MCSVALDWLTDLQGIADGGGKSGQGKLKRTFLEKLKKFTMGGINDFIM